MLRLLSLFSFSLVSVAWGAEESDCVKLYNLSKSNPGVFAGFGRARTPDAAVDAARVDMAKEISSKVSATTKTLETNKSISVDSVIESKVNLALVNAKVSRRCSSGGGSEAVVTLPREILLKNLRTTLESSEEKAQGFLARIKEAKGQSRVNLLVESKKFLDDTAYEESLALCRSFGGCADVTREGLKSLQSVLDDKENAELVGKANLFTVKFENELAEETGGEVKALLQEDGVVISSEAPASQVVRVDCSEQIFPKVGESQIIELTCRATGTADGQKKFSYKYSARGVGPSAKDARVIARNQLARQ